MNTEYQTQSRKCASERRLCHISWFFAGLNSSLQLAVETGLVRATMGWLADQWRRGWRIATHPSHLLRFCGGRKKNRISVDGLSPPLFYTAQLESCMKLHEVGWPVLPNLCSVVLHIAAVAVAGLLELRPCPKMSATRGDPLVTATPPLSGLLVGGFLSSPEYILFTIQEVYKFQYWYS
jgi:hypothetical protein